MQCGNKVSRPAENDVKDWWYAMDIQNIASLHRIPGSDYQCSYDKWISTVANTGWQIFDPKSTKTPIVECKNCIKKCGKRNDSIDHCVDYEPEPAFKVGDWVEFIDVGGRKSQGKYLSKAYDHAILVLDISYKINARCVVPTAKIIRKLAPSEVKVAITLTGTVSQDSILDKAGCFTLKTAGSEYITYLS